MLRGNDDEQRAHLAAIIGVVAYGIARALLAAQPEQADAQARQAADDAERFALEKLPRD